MTATEGIEPSSNELARCTIVGGRGMELMTLERDRQREEKKGKEGHVNKGKGRWEKKGEIER